jgi:hypothetical protein
MKTEYVLLLSIALAIPALAGETKSTGNAGAKSSDPVASKADIAQSNLANPEAIPNRPPRKNRVHQTFPPPAKRM